ncbi:integrin alpha-8 isoform X1 [Dasypus novemcinctus]|uniref:integrin alpha-8 isoform X1 n=1 Tax=Dasypus novemcinctus TaxID=9361 RepID=UPI00265FB7F1|nr:integrin alpha-8 isoform X2 [Dasypus novemcinctus]
MSAGARWRGGRRALPLGARLWCVSAALGMLWPPGSRAFNLDVEKPTVYSGPAGSYFGYAVDFHGPDAHAVSILVGAPKANTSQPDIVEGGAVYYCPWSVEGSAQCKQIPFDNTNNRKIRVNGTKEPIEFKSNQWFGATVRAHRGRVVACAPLYHWRTLRPVLEKDPVGTCYVAIQNFSAFAEYSPCRNSNADPEGQGYCQAGFSLDFHKSGDLIVGGPGSFYWQGQVITASVADIIANYSFKDILRKLAREKQTDVAPASYDDSYLGYSVAAGEFTGDLQQELVAGVPRGAQNFGYVSIINSTDMTFIQNFTGEQMASYFGYTVAVSDVNNDGMDDVLVGAPLYMEREVESSPREVGRVYLFVQVSPLIFRDPQVLAGSEAFGRFGTAIAHLGDLDQDGYNDLLVGAFGTGKVVVYRARPVVTVDAQLLLQPAIINLENKTCQIPGSMTPVACFSVRACASATGQSVSNTVALTAELHLDSLKQRGAVRRTLFLGNHQPRLAFALAVEAQRPPRCRDWGVYLRDETEFRDKLSPINIRLNFSLDESTFKEGLAVNPILNHYRERAVSEQAHILVDCGEDNLCLPDLRLSARPDKHQVIIGDENHLMLIINARNEGEGAYEAELYVTVPEEADYVGIERSNKGLQPLSCEHKTENGSRAVLCDLGNPMASRTHYTLGLRFAVSRLENTNQSINFDLQIKSSNKDNPDSNFVSLQINITAVAQVEIRGVSHPPQIILPVHNWDPEEEPRKEEGVGPLVEHVYELHNAGPSSIRDTRLEVGWPLSFRGEFLLYIFHIETLGPLQCQTNPDINPQDIKPAASREDTPELSAFLRNSTIPHLVRRRHVPEVGPYRQRPAKVLNCTNTECLRISCTVGRLDSGQSAVLKVRSRLWARTFLQRKNDPYALASLVSFEVQTMPYAEQPAELPKGSVAIKTSVVWATPNVSFSIPFWVIILAILLGLLVLAILTLALWKFCPVLLLAPLRSPCSIFTCTGSPWPPGAFSELLHLPNRFNLVAGRPPGEQETVLQFHVSCTQHGIVGWHRVGAATARVGSSPGAGASRTWVAGTGVKALPLRFRRTARPSAQLHPLPPRWPNPASPLRATAAP